MKIPLGTKICILYRRDFAISECVIVGFHCIIKLRFSPMSRRWHPYLQVFVGLKFEGIPLEGWRMGFGFRQSLFLSPHCEKKKVNTRTRKGGMKGKKMKKTNEVRWMCLLDGNSFGGEVVIVVVVVVLVFITTFCEIAPTPKMRSVNQSSNTKKGAVYFLTEYS